MAEGELIGLARQSYLGKHGLTCKACGSSVLMYLANREICRQRPEAQDFDFWATCENADCCFSYGVGYFQGAPSICSEGKLQ